MKLTLQDVLECIRTEEELDGEMPFLVWNTIREDKEYCEEAMRIVVRQTKKNIEERILIALNEKTIGETND